VKPGTLDLERMRSKEKRTLSTEPDMLEAYEFNMSDFYYESGDPEPTTGEIKGLWLRLTAQRRAVKPF
jgi:hypothetical protein